MYITSTITQQSSFCSTPDSVFISFLPRLAIKIYTHLCFVWKFNNDAHVLLLLLIGQPRQTDRQTGRQRDRAQVSGYWYAKLTAGRKMTALITQRQKWVYNVNDRFTLIRRDDGEHLIRREPEYKSARLETRLLLLHEIDREEDPPLRQAATPGFVVTS